MTTTQPAVEDLRNAQAIARVWAQAGYYELDANGDEALAAYQRIDELLGVALAKLAEPNAAAVDAARVVLEARTYEGQAVSLREARDAAAAILRNALCQ